MTEIHKIDIAGDRADQMRKDLHQAVENACDGSCPDIGGFALVVWDMRGQSYTAVCCDIGPVGETLVPTFAMSTLQNHCAVLAIDRVRARPINPDGAA